MKIILSRKGFDIANGGKPSPILPNGQIISFPIPVNHSTDSWEQIESNGADLDKIVKDLLPPKYWSHGLHIDPDINRSRTKRPKDWRPAFGQFERAAGHLLNQKVEKGDLFLFFGSFKNIHQNEKSGKWEYYGKEFHSLFGWLEIGDVINTRYQNPLEVYPFLSIHPHMQPSYFSEKNRNKNNLIFVSKERSDFVENCVGGGIFNNFTSELILSKEERTKKFWHLPRFFDPRNRIEHGLSHHQQDWRWTDDIDNPEKIILQTVDIGQEFVLDTQHFPEAKDWAINLIKNHVKP